MSSKNPISFAFSILFEIAAVVAIVSVLPKINLRPSASASQSPQTLPIEITDLRMQSQQLWNDLGRASETSRPQETRPAIEATPANPQYVEQQLDRASQRLLNTMGGAVNQASQDWLKPVPPQTTFGAPTNSFPTQNDFASPPAAKQTAQKPTHWPTATQKLQEPRPWLRY